MGDPFPRADAAHTLSPDDEAELIRAAQSNPARFRPLYLQWVAPVYKYLLARLRDPLEAEDLTSQVFLTACEQLPHYNHRGRFAAWLFTIARNKARDYYRSAGRSASLDEAEARGSDPDLLAQAIQSEEIRHLERVIRTLPEPELDLVRLRFTAGLSYADIGALLGKREDAVRKQLARLLTRLQSQMEDDDA
ncbi:MAG: sigma-70 family RNA polymerase sigma factor [Chloroflexi bacterium]|nr:sigma-70 family RNA polymerase sigma factor [Chloroflexota bacterium]